MRYYISLAALFFSLMACSGFGKSVEEATPVAEKSAEVGTAAVMGVIEKEIEGLTPEQLKEIASAIETGIKEIVLGILTTGLGWESILLYVGSAVGTLVGARFAWAKALVPLFNLVMSLFKKKTTNE